MKHTLYFQVKKLNNQDKSEFQLAQFTSKLLPIYEVANSNIPQTDPLKDFIKHVDDFEWK